MSFYFSDELLDEIRNKVDIVDLVGQYVHLKKSGRNYFGLCPFHGERTPSFSVSPDKQIFYCFGCGAGGNVFNFIMDIEQLTFGEAVEHLAGIANVTLPKKPEGSLNEKEEDERNKLLTIYTLSAKFYHHLLLHTEFGLVGLNYLKNRRIEQNTIVEFNIGYIPEGKDNLYQFLLKRGFSENLLLESDLINKGQNGIFDRFRNRIMIPLHDIHGNVIAFGGRVIGEGEPKYLNSSETKLFNKSFYLFNLHRARKEIRKTRQVILTEGYLDVITLWQAGYYNVVATLGTSLTIEHAKILRRNAEQVLICYDGDQAGQKAAFRAIDILQSEGLAVKVLQIPRYKDPDEFIRNEGREKFQQEVINNAITATLYKLQYIRKDYSLLDEQERTKYLVKSLEIIADLPHAIEREHYLKELSLEFQISLDSLKKDLQNFLYKKKKKEKEKDNYSNKWNNRQDESKCTKGNIPVTVQRAEKMLVSWMIKSPDVTRIVQKEIGERFLTEELLAIAIYLYAFYTERNEVDVVQFLQYLKDEKLVKIATELIMNPLSEEWNIAAVNDYIKHILNAPLLQELEEKSKQQQQLERVGEKELAKNLGLEIIKLRKMLKLK